MIRHCVMLKLRPEVDRVELDAVFAGLDTLVQRLEGCGGFICGPNRDFEDKSPDFPYGFTLDAQDQAALMRYAEHPEHKALGARLVQLCTGGAAGIMVFDIEGAG